MSSSTTPDPLSSQSPVSLYRAWNNFEERKDKDLNPGDLDYLIYRPNDWFEDPTLVEDARTVKRRWRRDVDSYLGSTQYSTDVDYEIPLVTLTKPKSPPKSFAGFHKLPPELQCMVINSALPGPRVIDLGRLLTPYDRFSEEFIGKGKSDAWTELKGIIQASSLLRTEALRKYKQVGPSAILPLWGVLPPIGQQTSAHVLEPDGISPAPEAWGASFEFANDTLLAVVDDLMAMCDQGACIMNLRNVKHLAVRSYFFEELTVEFEERLEFVMGHFPELQTLKLVYGAESHQYDSSTWKSIVIDVDAGFFHHLQLFNVAGRLKTDPELVCRYSNARFKTIERLYKSCLAERTANHQDDESEYRTEYWKRVKVSFAMEGILVPDRTWEYVGKRTPEPFLWVEELGSCLKCHSDGSLLDQYKGLAQIFDGAPW